MKIPESIGFIIFLCVMIWIVNSLLKVKGEKLIEVAERTKIIQSEPSIPRFNNFWNSILVILTFVLFVIPFILPFIFEITLGHYYIKLHTDFVYNYSYFGVFHIISPSLERGLGLFAYLFSAVFLGSTFVLVITILGKMQKVSVRSKKILKIMGILFIPVLILLLYFSLNPYLLIGDDGILYSPSWLSKQKIYQWQNVESVYLRHKDKKTDYYLFLDDGIRVGISSTVAEFVSQKSNLPIIVNDQKQF